MYDYEYLVVTELHRRLKEKIFGKVWTKAYHDELHVVIESFNDVRYEFVLNNFSDRILHGLNSEYLAYDVIRDYKRYLMKRYFIQEKREDVCYGRQSENFNRKNESCYC